jgi:acyl-CoA reductase-like NAD-dependent aldehyde dehydrogenase
MAVAATGELRVVNPATLELVGTVTTTDSAAVQEVVTAAKPVAERDAGRRVGRRAVLALARTHRR